MPYSDKQRRIYGHGELTPIELSPFQYNETIAQEFFPLTPERARAENYPWYEQEKRAYTITKKSEELPDSIMEVSEEITNEIIECAHKGKCNDQCATAFKIIPQEILFYKKFNLPLPRLCPNCRHGMRLKLKNPMKLWHRECMCDYGIHSNSVKHAHHPSGRCPNEFETSYSPDRKEIVYCEECYQAEVA